MCASTFTELAVLVEVWGVYLGDKRSQSKGDVEVMKTEALRGRQLLEEGAAVTLEHFRAASSVCLPQP